MRSTETASGAQPREAKDVRPLTGNEAIARGAWEAGVKVAAAYPGTPSTEILESLATYPAEDLHAQWSTNEKVALDVAMGASFAGRRAFAAMKHVGLNVAADAFMSQTYIGVNGGLVLAVCDDPGIHSSQNEQDTRIYGALASVPILEPSDSQEALDFTRLAFDLSERFDTPVIVRGTTRLSHTRSPVAVGEREEPEPRGFLEQPSKNVMIPAYARPRHVAVIEREKKLKDYFDEAPINRWEPGDASFGVVTAGTCYPYVREVLPLLRVGRPHFRCRRARAGDREGNPRAGLRGRGQALFPARRRIVARIGALRLRAGGRS
jgi:indolepyruvate ferredoxin oxidoreductase alpha subunit